MKSAYPGLTIMGGRADKVPGCTVPVNNGDSFELFGGNIKLTCYVTPCHTVGSTNYYLEAAGCVDGTQHETKVINEYTILSNLNRCVFTGDTVFIGGCGLFMEGDAAQMLAAMDVI